METYQFYEIYTFYFRIYFDQETAPLVNEENLITIILALINSKSHFKKKRLIYVKSFRLSYFLSVTNLYTVKGCTVKYVLLLPCYLGKFRILEE